MRFLLRNVSADALFEQRRNRHPGKSARRPVIGGSVLAPGSSRALNAEQLTQELLHEIEEHQEAGNVQLVQIGKGEVNFPELLKTLRMVPKTMGKLAEIVQDIVKGNIGELISDVKDILPAAKQIVHGVKEIVDEVKEVRAEQAATPEELAPAPVLPQDPKDPVYTEEDLSKMNADSLRSVLARLGGSTGGKSKGAMRQEILALQAAK